MAKFVISPSQNLSGEIEVYGAKNAAIKMIAASLLISGQTILDRVPDILDIQKIIEILQKMGVKITRQDHRLTIDTTNFNPTDPDPKLVKKIRASVILVGPMLARFGKITLPHPGGCIIGPRPIDEHIRAFKTFGVQVAEKDDRYQFEYHKSPMHDINLAFSKISVSATENVLLFSALRDGTTTISNAAIEPEILDLVNFLNQAGAQITHRDRTFTIKGVDKLNSASYTVMPDRIEAGTFAILGVLATDSLKITNMNPDHLQPLLDNFTLMGIQFEKGPDFLYIKKPQSFRAIDITTAPYPGFPTDLQSPMGLLLTQAQGTSYITEAVFQNRLGYLKELAQMGAEIKFISETEAQITGPRALKGAKLESLDLRAGATLLMAGLIAEGETQILHAENIDRGYEKIEERFAKIGAKIQRVL